MAILLASILDADWSKLPDEVRAVDMAGVDGFSIDIMDGLFVPRTTFDARAVSEIRKITRRPIEVHLMVASPEAAIDKFCNTGVDQIIFHIEAANDPLTLVKYIHARGLRAGLALLQETPPDEISDYLYEAIDALNLMSVPVGFGGQKPSSDTLERIRLIREKVESINPNLSIEIDGGMKPDNCFDFVKAGADAIVIGTGIYKSDNYKSAVDTAKNNMTESDALSRKRLESFLSRRNYNVI